MNLAQVNKVRRRAAGLLCACFILLVLGYLEAAWMDYYFLPNIVATPERIYLVYRRNPQLGITPSSYIHTSPDGKDWSEAVYVPFDPGSCQISGDDLYALRGDYFSVYSVKSLLEENKEDWKRSVSFGLDWRVVFAFLEGENLRLIGIEEIDKDKVKIREAEVSGSTTSGLGYSVEIPRPELVAACSDNGSIFLLHRKAGEDTIHILKREPGKEWDKFGEINDMPGRFDCACVSGLLHVAGSPVRRGEPGSWRLVHYSVDADGAVRGPTEVLHDLRNYLGSPREVSEVSLAGLGGTLYLAGRFGNVIASTVWEKETWSSFTTVNKVPLGTKVVMWVWFSSVLALCGALIMTGYHLYLAKRGRLAVKTLPGPVPYENASLMRRFGAFSIDYVIIQVVIFLIMQPAQSVPGGRSLLEFLQLDHPLMLQVILLAYFSLPEMILGQTLGKGLFGIAIKSQEGRRAGAWAVVLRNMFKLNILLIIIEGLVIMSIEKPRRVGDLVAGTAVVRKDRRGG